MDEISKPQNRKIWVMAKELGLDKDLLHEFIANITSKKSISSLTKTEAIKVIDAMEKQIKGKRATPPPNRVSKEQLWKMNQLARELGWDNNPKRLLGFVKKYAKVERLEWLTPAQAWRVIEGLKKLAAKTVTEACQNEVVDRKAENGL